MKRSFTALLIVSLLMMATTAGAASSGELKLSKIEGVVSSFSSGSDAFTLTLTDLSGKTRVFREKAGSQESFSQEEKKELEAMKAKMAGKKWPGSYFPTVMDLYSSVRIWYIESPECYLSYEVLKRPAALWLSIVASSKDSAEAWSSGGRLKDQGFETREVLFTTPYKSLRPGLFIVVNGACRSEAEAQKICTMSRQKGWKDAYIKKVW